MKKPTVVRSLAEADPKYADALEVRQRVRTKLSDLDAEEVRLLERIGKEKISTAVESNAVALLLGDELSEEADKDGPRARLRAIHGERSAARRALEIAEQRLQAARFGASSIVVGEVAGEYDARVKALAAALVSANKAHEDLLTLINDLNRQDVAWSGMCEPMQAFNIFGDHGARVGAWLKSAKRAGFIDLVPEGLK